MQLKACPARCKHMVLMHDVISCWAYLQCTEHAQVCLTCMPSQACSDTLAHMLQAPSASMWKSQMPIIASACPHWHKSDNWPTKQRKDKVRGKSMWGLTNDKAEQQIHERSNCAASRARLQRLYLEWIQPSQGPPCHVTATAEHML